MAHELDDIRLIELTTDSTKVLYKFLLSLRLENLVNAGLNAEERDAFLEVFGQVRGEVEEIQLDEAHTAEKEQSHV